MIRAQKVLLPLWLLALASPPATAADPTASLPEVRALLINGQAKEALKQLKTIEENLDTADVVVPSEALASLWIYRGIAEHLLGGKKGRDLDAWRQALTVHNDASLDASLIGDKDVLGLFEALRGEVASRGTIDPGLPEAVGVARLYVDGVRLSAGDTLLPGLHLAQITCPEPQGTFSVLTEFKRPLDWLALCPEGVDTSVVAPEEDEWAAFGPTFGTPPESSTSTSTPTSTTTTTASEPVVSTAGPKEGGSRVLGVTLLTSGGALLVGGAVVNFAVVAPTYADIEAARSYPNTITRAEADDLTSRFNASRAATMVMLGGGALLLGTSAFVDAPVQPQVGWGVVGVGGRF